MKTYYDKVRSRVEGYFNGRFKIYLTSFQEGGNFFRATIKDNFDGCEHDITLTGISEKDFMEKINKIILGKRDDTIDSIIENYGKV